MKELRKEIEAKILGLPERIVKTDNGYLLVKTVGTAEVGDKIYITDDGGTTNVIIDFATGAVETIENACGQAKELKMNEYEKEAREVAGKYGIKIRPLKKEHGFYFDDDEKNGHLRDIYTLLITSPFYGYTFTFGESLNDSTGKAGETIFFDKDEEIELYYSILASVQKYEVGNIDDFIADFGYDFSCDSYEEAKEKISSIQKTYNAVKEEHKNFSSLFENGIIPDDILEIC